MASEQFSGTEGGVYLGANKVGEFDSWDFTVDANMLKTTAFGDTWTKQKPGIKSWSGKGSGRWNVSGDTTGQKALEDSLFGGTQITVTFKVDDTKSYTGDCFVKSEAPKSSVDGTVDVDFSFEGNGPLVATYS